MPNDQPTRHHWVIEGCLTLSVGILAFFIFVSRAVHLLSSTLFRRQHNRTFAIGLLGTTDISKLEDKWMVADFVGLRKLIGAEDDSLWLCAVPLSKEPFLLGEPEIVLQPATFATYVDSPYILRLRFLTEVKRKAGGLSATDILVLVLVGHGSTDVFTLGDPNVKGGSCEIVKSDLEAHLKGTKGTIWLIHTGCESESWESPCWFLLAAMDANQASIPISVDGSNEARGSFLASALITKQENARGVRGEQLLSDYGVDSLTQHIPLSLIKTLKHVWQQIHEWKDRRDKTLTTSFSMKPSEPQLNMLPFRLLNSSSATSGHYRFRCVPPLRLSFAEQTQLSDLARDFMQSMPVSIPRDIGTISKCDWIVKGRPVPQEVQFRLLSNLKDRKQLQECAMAIAENLGWKTGIASVGKAGTRDYYPSFVLHREAEEAGCLVSTVCGNQHRAMRYVGAAHWLALVWEAEGRPRVDSSLWNSAYTQAIAEKDYDS